MSRQGVQDNIPKWFNASEQLELGASCLILGSRHTGKSVLQWDLLSHLAGQFDYGLAVTPTDDTREQLMKAMPECLIRKDEVEFIDSLMTMMDETNITRKYRGKEKKQAILILDDTAYNKPLMRSNTLSEMMMNGRHLQITVIMTLQYLKTVEPSSRKNSDYVFIRQEGDLDVRKDIHRSWFGSIPMKEFERIFDYCTQGYGVLVRDSRMAVKHPKDWRKWVFRYCARPPEKIPPFQLLKSNFSLLGNVCATTREYRMGYSATKQINEEED